jgi:hypothetical protein
VRYAIGLALLLAPFLAAWNQYRADAHERRLSRIGSEIAGREVDVRCQGVFSHAIDIDWKAGEVQFDDNGQPADWTTLKRPICRRLARFPDAIDDEAFACVARRMPCDRDAAMLVHAVHILAHEAWHLRGVASEAAAECYAIQTEAGVARRLGAGAEQGQAVAEFYLRELYPHMPQTYRSDDCRNGGALDLRPESSTWP